MYGPPDCERVERLIRRRWSAEQVVAWLKRGRRVRTRVMSRSTIYRYLHRDKAKGGVLWRYSRGLTKKWRKLYRSQDSRGRLGGKRSIDERPPGAHNRSRARHW